MIVAMNIATPPNEGGNFENIVDEVEFVSDASAINCVMFPSYLNPKLSPLDQHLFGHSYSYRTLRETGEKSNLDFTKYSILLLFTYTGVTSVWLKPNMVS